MKPIYRNETTLKFKKLVKESEHAYLEAVELTDREFIDLVNELPNRKDLCITTLFGDVEIMCTALGCHTVSELDPRDIILYLRKSERQDHVIITIYGVAVKVQLDLYTPLQR